MKNNFCSWIYTYINHKLYVIIGLHITMMIDGRDYNHFECISVVQFFYQVFFSKYKYP